MMWPNRSVRPRSSPLSPAIMTTIEDEDSDEAFVVRSTRHGRRLVFYDRDDDYFMAAIRGPELSVATRVWGYSDTSLLIDLFASLAADWRGWAESRSWQSIEGEFTVAASFAVCGIVTLDVAIRQADGVDDLRFQAPIFTESGQLDSIAAGAKRFFAS